MELEPTFVFKCHDCRTSFENYGLGPGEHPVCPRCGSQNIVDHCDHRMVFRGEYWECKWCGAKEVKPGTLR